MSASRQPARHLFAEDYWAQKLAGVVGSPLCRPGVQGAAPAAAGSPREVRLALPPALTTRLERAAAGNEAGVFLLLLAGLTVLVSRYTESSRPLIASSPFPRGEPAAAGLVFFRPSLDGEPALARLLVTLTRELEEVRDHLGFDLPRLLDRLRSDPANDERALFAVGLTYDAFNQDSSRLDDLEVWFGVERQEYGLGLSIRDRRGRCSDGYLAQLGRHFQNALDGLLAHSGRPVGGVDLLSDEERREIVVGLNPPATAYPERQTLAELFAEQAAKSPDRAAVVCGDRRLTYGELEHRAGRLAGELVDRGIGPDALVGVMLKRSELLIVALLAILKAGGAYVPLDPEYPAARIGRMLDEIGGRLVLSEGEELARLTALGAPVLDVAQPLSRDQPRDQRRDQRARELGPRSDTARGTSRNLAYAMFTSGSTGRPKGVLVEQRSVTRLVRDTNYLEIRPGDHLLQTGSMSFDASTLEVWGALLNGATLHLAPREELLEVARLGPLLARHGITCIWLTASLFNQIVDQDAALFAPLRVLLVGGERLSPPHVERVRRAHPGLAVINGYGPTENTTFTACFSVRESLAGEIPIGRPIANTRVYVVDGEDRPAPRGVVGELCCAGAGLARGYLDQPERTAERFVPDPFADGERMYRTGDLARWSEAGVLDFVGRRDAQVKIRGFRIEPGEIDHRLRELASVRAAVTVAREVAGERALVAYVVSAGTFDAADLRRELGRTLPGFMIPACFVDLDRLPLSPNGKVDLAALPNVSTAAARQDRVAPRNAAEERLLAVWEEVLGQPGIGVEDSFFDLGGHSLKATAIIARAQAELGLDLRLADLFEAPTVAALAARAAERDLAARAAGWSPADAAAAVPHAAIARAAREGELPLSSAQQRMWFLDRWEPGGAAYNLPGSVSLTGRLQVPALAAALAEVARRHEVLRTIYEEVDGRPRPRLDPALAVVLPVVDLAALPAADRRREAVLLAAAEGRRPFDLSRGPLLRCRLLRLEPEEHALLVTLHHIAADGWSVGVLSQEMKALYGAFAAGRPSPLPALPIQYVDYAAWQRQELAGPRCAADLAYWLDRLRDLPALDLPADRRAGAVPACRAGVVRSPLAGGLAAALSGLARRAGATLFMTVLAGFQALLARCCGQDDVAVGSPVAGRGRAETEPLIGLFVNTVVLRTDLAGDPAAADLLERVKQVTLTALAHQELPFEVVVERCAPERDLRGSPLFQVMFALQNLSLAALELPGLCSQPLAVDPGAPKFALTLYLEEAASGPALALEYDRELFDAATALRLDAHLRALLAAMAASSERRLSALSPLDESARQQVLVEWNDTGGGAPPGPCLHHLFAAQAARTPDVRAVVCAGQSLTYGELDRRSARLALRLAARGAGPEVLVGLCSERTLDLAVGLLAILRAGGAYVPLDPAYPAARLEGMLEDSGVRMILVQERLAERFAGRAALIPLDRLGQLDKAGDRDDAKPSPAATGAGGQAGQAGSGNLAYLIYTSGSSGRPKAVAIEHRSAVALLDWALQVYGAEDLAGVLASTSLCFDLSVFELFLPWSRGGTVLLAENALALASVATAEQVTLLNTVPSAAAALVREGALPPSLRTVNLAGEPLSDLLVAEIFRSAAGVQRLFDLYGPSEDTTYSTFAARRPGGPAVVGRPIAGTRSFLLDAQLRPVPLRVSGELYLGGAGLARGYLHRPELTAERFLPDPFAARAGERLYRTGDLARHRADGDLELLGRADRQLKVRGFRIEPGEIEALLVRHPAVREAAVLARRGEEGDLRLAAYWVPSDLSPAALGWRELRRHLAERLPEPMLPAFFVRLAALPLLPNGKLDRAALSAPGGAPDAGASADGEPQRSRRPIEELLAGIWASVLGRDRVGVEDDFFALGGHSLMAMQVLSRIREAFGVDLAVRELFEARSPLALAARLELRLGDPAAGAAAAPPLGPRPPGEEPQLSFAQLRLWFLDRLEGGGAAYNIPLGLCLAGELDTPALESALAATVRRHEVLRAIFPADPGRSGRPCQVIRREPAPPLSCIDLAGLPPGRGEAEARRLAADEARAPFDLARGPLLRCRLVRLGPAEHRLLLTLHHIVADGWSLGVLMREVAAFYAAFASVDQIERIERAAVPTLPTLPTLHTLPALPIQYPDFAAWQRLCLEGEPREAQLRYWRQRLAGLAELRLPTDRPRGPRLSRRGGLLRTALPPRLAEDLGRLSRRRGLTLFMTLLTGFQAVLSRYAGQADVAVGSPVAGRNRAEVEGLIGLFVNTLVLRCDLAGDPRADELLGRVRETALGAYAHQELPFEMLVEALAPGRDTGRSPLFQAMLAVDSTPRRLPALPGLSLTPFEVETGAAKFELTLFLEEADGGLAGALEYDRDLFDAVTARRLLAHLETLLGQLVEHPESRLSSLALLAAAERHQLQVEWSGTAAAAVSATVSDAETCVPELLAAQSRRTPGAEALAFADERWTYAELAARVDHLAELLASLGVGPEVRVGICAEPSLELVVGVLAVLAAGGAYVPLEPSLPRERLAFMARDADLALILTQEGLSQERLAPSSPVEGVRHLCLDRLALVPRAAARREVRTAPASLAYVIYTSGSTGRPKGVMVSHGALASYVRWCLDAYGLDRGAGAPLHSPLGFDLTVTSLLPPLLAGRRVTIVPARPGIAALGRELGSGAGFSLVKLTPAHLDLLNRHLPAAARATATGTLILGGEALWAESLAAWRADAPATRLINEYGPTEATVGCCVYEIPAGDPAAGAVPIGRPIPGTLIHLLDDGLRPVPLGSAGELYVGGAGLARGYAGQPAQTALHFLPNPFAAAPGQRLYGTGDLARHRRDGCLEYLGRVDHQLKVRGFRVEPGEIEAALVGHPGVLEAVVVGRSPGRGDLRLVAYWVPRPEAPGGAPEAADLKRFLGERLPVYMIPAALVRLAALPLNRNGKVDRGALPAGGAERADPERAYTAPTTAAEAAIAEVWQHLLQVEKVGVEDNFFDAGGHSLLLLEVQTALQERLAVEIELIALFEHPTVRALAAYLNRDVATVTPLAVHARAQQQQQAARRSRQLQAQRRLGA